MLRLATATKKWRGVSRSPGSGAAGRNFLDVATARFFRPSKFLSSLLVAFVVTTVVTTMATPASAVIMSDFGGAWGSADQPFGGDSVNLNDGFPISPGTVGSLLTGGVVNDLFLDATGYTGVINGAGGFVTLSQISVTSGSGTAVFDLSNALLTQVEFALPSGPFGVGVLVADAVLNATLTSPILLAELAPFASPGASLVLTYNGITVDSAGGGTVTLGPSPTGSFTLTAIPEPSSVVLGMSGVLCLAATWISRRRRAANGNLTEFDALSVGNEAARDGAGSHRAATERNG